MASEEVTSFPVLFSSNGSLIAGRAYRPAGRADERRPGVLVTGSWLTVKEQMAAYYATALAERWLCGDHLRLHRLGPERRRTSAC